MKSSHSLAIDQKPHYEGHRQRLRSRFLESQGDSLADYELLEFLLFYAYPRIDTKPLAKGLLKRFGSLQAVLGSPFSCLADMKEISSSAQILLKLVHTLSLRAMKESLKGRIVLQSWQQVLDYCQASMSFLKEEQFRLLFLDQKNQLIADEVQQKGTVNHTPVYPREVIKRALELSASALIMIHNHPSGDPTPSRSDIDMTLKVVEAGAALGIKVHDHVIIGQGKNLSFKVMGIL